jgi:hypothetical protein
VAHGVKGNYRLHVTPTDRVWLRDSAATGVIDGSGERLERFLTHGVDAGTRAAIGDLPRGRGILGAVIHEATSLRLSDLGDPRQGFPPGTCP